MKKIIVGMALSACTLTALAQSPNCSGIKQDKQRLACYDKSASMAEKATLPPTTNSSTPLSSAKKLPDGVVFKSASWHVNQSLDAMTDKKSCTALYKNDWTIQGTANTLFISFRGRGGVKAYTLRIDDEEPNALQLATDVEKNISAADLYSSFDRIYNSKRVRLQVSTILGRLIVEDVDMHGFKEAVDYIRANCNI